MTGSRIQVASGNGRAISKNFQVFQEYGNQGRPRKLCTFGMLPVSSTHTSPRHLPLTAQGFQWLLLPPLQREAELEQLLCLEHLPRIEWLLPVMKLDGQSFPRSFRPSCRERSLGKCLSLTLGNGQDPIGRISPPAAGRPPYHQRQG